MSSNQKTILWFGFVALLLATIGFVQSWSVSLGIMNLCLISAIMAL
ncbi:MAG: branched-chain amino acid transport system permease protein, partial [Gammaproteobacteria bacterium]